MAAQPPAAQPPICPASLRMPPYYAACVLLGITGFAIVLAALLALFSWLIWSGISPFVHMNFGRGPVTVPGAILRIALGLLFFLLIGRTLRQSEEWKGIEIARGSCPPLEDLVADCAARAGIVPPEALYLTPDGNIAAFNSGMVRGSGHHSNFLNIGAMLLPGLNRYELEAAFFHEFAHLVMRANQWAVALDNRIRDFVPRLRLLTQRGGKIFFIAIYAGRVLLLWYWNLYNLLMAPLRRREEFLADQFAAAHCGPAQYARALSTILILQRAFDVEMADSINGSFHAELLGMPENPAPQDFPNWFAIAGSVFSPTFLPKLDQSLAWLRDAEQQKLLDEHPTFRARLDRLHQAMPDSVQELISDVGTLGTGEEWQRLVSAAFAQRMRPFFFQAKLEAGLALDDGFTSDSVASFPCRFKSCSVFGKTHLRLSRQGIQWIFQNGPGDPIAWNDLAAVEVYPDGRPSGRNGPAISWLFAQYYGLPSLAEVELVWPQQANGSVNRQTLQLFHLGENMQEAMDLLSPLSMGDRAVAASPGRGVPVLLRDLESTLAAESGPAAGPQLIETQTSLIQQTYRQNSGQIRSIEFAGLLELYETLLRKAPDPATWAASVQGRSLVLEQLNLRQALRLRIAGLGLFSFFGRLLWMPLWVRLAVVGGSLIFLGQAIYFVLTWYRQTAVRFFPFTHQAFTAAWFHFLFNIGVTLLSLSLAARIFGYSVMESLDSIEFRATHAQPAAHASASQQQPSEHL